MNDTLRRIRANPKVALAALVALGAFLWWRRGGGGGGGGGGTSSLAPLTDGTVATGDFSTLPVDPEPAATGPITIPAPSAGGIIIPSPGADPIVFLPPPPVVAPPATPPPAGTPARLFHFNRYWSRGQIDAFHREWARRHAGRDTPKAWRAYLTAHPRVRRFFFGSTATAAATSASSAAAAPAVQVAAGSLTAGGAAV